MGDLQGLQHVNSTKLIPWTPRQLCDIIEFAKGLDVINWLHTELGAPLLRKRCYSAAEQGDFEVFEWLRERNTPFSNADAAFFAVRGCQLPMLQFLDSINATAWTEDELSLLLAAAIGTGTVEMCDWLHERFHPDMQPEHVAETECYRPELLTVQWAIQHGLTWQQLTECKPGNRLRCWDLRFLSCEAFHWAHVNGLVCTCPAHGIYDHKREDREHIGWELSDAVFGCSSSYGYKCLRVSASDERNT